VHRWTKLASMHFLNQNRPDGAIAG